MSSEAVCLVTACHEAGEFPGCGAWQLQGVGDGSLIAPEALLAEPLGNEALLLPERRVDVDFSAVSSVLSQRMLCHPNAPLEFQQNTIPHRGAHKDTREVGPALP